MIEIDRATFTYPEGTTVAIRDVSVRVDPGKTVLLRGASGSGKSTLLRCLNGLVPKSSGGRFTGTVRVCGLDTHDHPLRVLGSHVGFVFQHPEAQFIFDDVESELAFGLENLGLPRTLIRRRIEEVLDQVGIAGLRRRRVATLSSGERQRVALAAVLAMHPEVIALDEPTSQLDPQAAEDVLQAVTRLSGELGLTVIIAEHRVERIASFIDRVWTLDSGCLSEADTREALAKGGARPPVVDLALRAGWPSLPITVGEARPYAASLRPHLSQAPPSERKPGPIVRTLKGVTFSYPQAAIPVLQGLDLDLHAGEVAVLMGRNGSGKTTLLKLIAGLLRPSRGRVAGYKNARYVPQDADLLLFRPTVREELPSDGPWQERFAGRLERYPRDLSTGERQQVAIAAAAGGSTILLLDEPTRGLDPDTKRWLGDFLRGCAAEGTSILVATHDVEWAARFAQRVLLLGDGELYADGIPREVLTDSLVFSTQVNKLLGKGWLLPEEVPLPVAH